MILSAFLGRRVRLTVCVLCDSLSVQLQLLLAAKAVRPSIPLMLVEERQLTAKAGILVATPTAHAFGEEFEDAMAMTLSLLLSSLVPVVPPAHSLTALTQ